jgi:hypothetical protein
MEIAVILPCENSGRSAGEKANRRIWSHPKNAILFYPEKVLIHLIPQGFHHAARRCVTKERYAG